MDFDAYFTAVQGSLRSLEKNNEIPFNEIGEGNGDLIKKIVEIIESLIEDEKIQSNELRRLHLLFVLNTDFHSVELLENDVNFCHLITTLPKLSPFLYFKLTEKLKLHKFLGEAILHCPEVLSIDILSCVSTNLKNLEPDLAINFLTSLYESLFQKIINLREDSRSKKHKFVKAFQTLLAFSLKEILDKLPWKMEKKDQFMGFAMKMYFTLVETCVLCFHRGCIVRKMDIYNMSINFDYSKWDCVKNDIDPVAHCLDLLLSKCRKLAMDITVDMYMSWCEIDLDGSDQKSLQTSVRETAYTCKEILKCLSSEDFPDAPLLISTLSNFALKPKTEDDEIDEASLESILFNLKNPEKNKRKWFMALLKHEDIFTNKSCLDLIRENMKILDLELVLFFIARTHEYLSNIDKNSDEAEEIKHLVFECLKSLLKPVQLSILMEYYNSFGNSSVLKSIRFENMLTEVLNKMVQQEFMKDKIDPVFIWLCLQSGEDVVERLLKDSLTSEHLCHIAISSLKIVFPLPLLTIPKEEGLKICTHKLIQLLKNFNKWSPEEKQNCVNLTKNLVRNKFLDVDHFLSEHLMISIETSLDEEDWSKILFWLDLLLPFVDGSCGDGVIEKPVVQLSYIIQVLNKSRRQPRFFTQMSMEACEKSIVLVTLLVDILINSKKEEDSEVIFLRGLASSTAPMTWYHLRRLWFHWGQDLPPGDLTLTWSKPFLGHKSLTLLSDNDRALLVTSVCKVLPLLTSLEWKTIGTEICDSSIDEALELFSILLDGILVLLQVPLMLRNLPCLSQTVAHLLVFVKFRTLPCLEGSASSDQTNIAMKKIIIALNEIPVEIVKERMFQFLKIIQDVLTISLSKSMAEENLGSLRDAIEMISDEAIRSGILKCFQESTTSKDQP